MLSTSLGVPTTSKATQRGRIMSSLASRALMKCSTSSRSEISQRRRKRACMRGIVASSARIFTASLNLLTASRQFRAAVLSDGYDDFVAWYGDVTGYGQQAIEGRPHS